jgi:signal transduction histidine kinase
MSAVPETDLPSVQRAALRRVAGLVASGAAPSEVFAAIAYEVAQVTGSALLQIQRFEPDDTVTVAGAWGAAPHPFRPVRVDDFGASAPIVVDGKLWGVMAAGPAEGEPVPEGLEERLVEFTELIATAISNAESREALKRLADEQAALRRVATLVAKGVPPAELFEAVAREAGQLLGVDAMHMGRYHQGAAISVAGWSRQGDHLPVGTRVELDGTNVASLVLKSGRPARIDGYSGETGAMADRLRRRMDVYSSVAVPIVVDGRLWGLMIASSKQAQALPADTESRLLGFTELAETAISNTEAGVALAASRARLVAAADEERRRVVGDLHSGAQQRLEDTIGTLERAERELGEDEGRARELVKEALSHAERTTAELRELAHGILPSVLTSGGLRAAADALASRMTITVGVDVATGRHPSPIEATAYFVIAEALTNVAKHSGAQVATVTTRVENGALRVQVRDDGAGGARTDGSGLVGLRDRLAAHEGTLTVDSPPSAGTVVTATIPLSAVT